MTTAEIERDVLRRDARHYCRNARCRMKLPAPVENEHHAFCCTGCYGIFYRHRCLVCDAPMRSARRTYCGRRCENEQRRFPRVFAFPGQSPVERGIDARSADEMGAETAVTAARPWRRIAGPTLSARSFALAILPLDPETARRAQRANAEAAITDSGGVFAERKWRTIVSTDGVIAETAP